MDKSENKNIPPIASLVLMGGQSTRMGTDKAFIDYHGKPQFLYLYQLLHELTGTVYLSCHPDRILQGDFNVITDVNAEMGPIGGVLAAFQKHPGHAWLVVACDHPYLNLDSLFYLIDNRDPSKLATCFYNAASGMTEPLITIWEPASLSFLTKESGHGKSLRKVLANADVHQIAPPDPRILINANTPEEVARIKSDIGLTSSE